jgi:hypothetical protein
MTISKNPFAKKLSTLDARRARFVRPELVAEVGFRAWATEGLIRHSSFMVCEKTSLPRKWYSNPRKRHALSAVISIAVA